MTKQTPFPDDPRITSARRQFFRALAALEEEYMRTGPTATAMRRIARMLRRLARDYAECAEENETFEREEVDDLTRWLREDEDPNRDTK